jgi:hypothetical protein
MTATSVYRLYPVLDDPDYEGFATDQESMRGKFAFCEDFLPDSDTGWHAPQLAKIWKPVKVEGRVRAVNDYPCINLSIPAFSKHAVEALREYLEANGELLPLNSRIGMYYAYNVTTIADVLDIDRAIVERFPDSGRVMTIDRYMFRQQQVSNLTIFQIPEQPGDVYVTDVFVRRAHESNLAGLNFVKVWPLSAGTDWRSLKKSADRARRRSTRSDLHR